ncbi:MAG TPA: hypothetical protein G4O11_07795 [Anaerolineae bacterium]|nr:hypothetical protein [Anaerolineae bacterium]
MLFQLPPADTFDFMVLGFGVILGSMALFLVSLAVRYRNLRRDLDLLEEMEADE